MFEFNAVIRATEYPPRLKHKVIFETFHALDRGGKMLLVNDHDPRPLYYQFEAEYAGRYSWEYLEKGPETYQVAIGKL